jgi:hypothetical protein
VDATGSTPGPTPELNEPTATAVQDAWCGFLSRAGDRQLNYALHVMAMAQIKRATPGRDYYQRKRAAGKPTKKPCVA